MGSGKTTVKATHHGSGNTKWTSYDTVTLNSPGSIMNYYTSEDVLKANDTDYSVKVVLHMTDYNRHSDSNNATYTFKFDGSKVY